MMLELIAFVIGLSMLSTPTYAELITFLNKNDVNKAHYVPGEYVCWNYACDLLEDATEAGIGMVYIQLIFPESSHAIVATLTSDRGVLFIEPQSDRPAHVSEGFKYWSWFVGTHYSRSDTILDVQVFEGPARCELLQEMRLMSALWNARPEPITRGQVER